MGQGLVRQSIGLVKFHPGWDLHSTPQSPPEILSALQTSSPNGPSWFSCNIYPSRNANGSQLSALSFQLLASSDGGAPFLARQTLGVDEPERCGSSALKILVIFGGQQLA